MQIITMHIETQWFNLTCNKSATHAIGAGLPHLPQGLHEREELVEVGGVKQ